MTAFLIKKNFHLDLCERIIEDIQYQRANYYYFLGRVSKWNTDDTSPSVIEDTFYSENSTRSEMVSIKKVVPSDVSFVTRRIDWTQNTVYDQYDSRIDLKTKNFYVLTDTFDVYKCLNNNYNVQSTVKPIGTSIFPITLSDGYVWKYMYTITPFKRNKFLSELKMPVQKAITDRFYNNGGIDSAIVTNGGSGYEQNLVTTILLTGGTTGSGGILTCTVENGIINTVNVVFGGSGYTAGCRINVYSTTGINAVLTPILSGGVIFGVTITNSGEHYLTAPTLTVQVGGAVVVPSISRDTGTFTKLTITDAGIGYTTAPALSIIGSTGTGKYDSNTSAVLKPIVSNGKLVEVTIEDGGLNYLYQTSPVISVLGDGTGAELSPVVDNSGKLIDVIVESRGTGYTYATGTVHGSGTGATVNIVLNDSNFLTAQSNVEQTAINGIITNLVILDSGVNYTTATITITGDGTGATATAVIVLGKIVKINMTNFGSNYTYAIATVTGDNKYVNPNSTDAILDVIISPVGGHGYDAVTELQADTVCIFSSIRHTANDYQISQDFREYGLVKNLRDLYTGNLITTDSGMCSYTVTLSSIYGIIKDEILLSGQFEFRVVEVLSSSNSVILISLSRNQLSTENILTAKNDRSRNYNILAINSTPVADKYSGRVLFVSDSDAFTFTNEQEITIKTFLKL